MDRDCGKGRLIPVRFNLVWCVGMSDEEQKKDVSDPSSTEFESILKGLPPCSNIRLYAWDKQGYANCIKSAYIDKEGLVADSTDRLHEL